MLPSDVDGFGPNALEALIRSADRLPKPTATFRKAVLARALYARRRSESVQRVQGVLTLWLVVAVLCGLPGYCRYHSVRDEYRSLPAISDTSSVPPPYFSRMTLAAMATAEPPTQVDEFEWNLVQAEFAIRDHSLRAFRGSL
jgi:hypothetical protein